MVDEGILREINKKDLLEKSLWKPTIVEASYMYTHTESGQMELPYYNGLAKPLLDTTS